MRPQGIAKMVGLFTNKMIVPERPKKPFDKRTRMVPAAAKPPAASTAPARRKPPIVAVIGFSVVVVRRTGKWT
jgi:hypothetical protein